MDAELLRFAEWLHEAGYLADPYSSEDTTSGNPQALVAQFSSVPISA